MKNFAHRKASNILGSILLHALDSENVAVGTDPPMAMKLQGYEVSLQAKSSVQGYKVPFDLKY